MFRSPLTIFWPLCLVLTAPGLPAQIHRPLPQKHLNGPSDWEAIGPEGGYFKSFAPHPDDPEIILAGGDDSSGIWKSTDGGNSWRLVSEELRNVTGWCLTRHFLNPDLVFTGDLYGRYPVLRSEDGGETWEPSYDGILPRRIGAVALDPTSLLRVYAGTGDGDYGPGNGVYRSDDGGRTWTQAGLQGKIVSHLEVLVDGTVLAGTPDGLRRSRDFGASWQNVFLPAFGVTAMETSPSRQRVWVAAPGLLHSIFRSDDFGSSWSWLSQPLRFIFTLAVAPTPSEDAIFEGLLLTSLGVQRSLDAGRTWVPANQGLSSRWTIGLGIAADQDLFAGNFSNHGIDRSQDGGQSWHPVNQDLHAYYATGMSFDPNDPNTLYTTTLGAYAFDEWAGHPDLMPRQTKKGVIDPLTGTITWTTLPGIQAQTYGLAVAPGNSSVLLMGTFEQGILLSRDGGQSVESVVNQGTSLGGYFDPDNPQIALAPLVDFVQVTAWIWRTEDQGNSWTAIPTPFSAVEIIMEPGSDRVWAATGSGMFLSLDNGLTWQNAGLAGISLESLAQHPQDPDFLYAGGADGRLYWTTDGGGHWQSAAPASWPKGAAVRELATHPSVPGALWVGLNGAELRNQYSDVMRGGVWLWWPASQQWIDLSTPTLTNDQIWGMALRTEGNQAMLYVATYGGGLFRRPLP
ncbi:MAG: hypothetical protein DWQ01_00900 [Planctomycetota bacterium]|nr:MAG: hypothetical protein DWQ01_00900 [Planctomycetota bacterium]